MFEPASPKRPRSGYERCPTFASQLSCAPTAGLAARTRAAAGDNGAFQIRGAPPGDYRLFAWRQIEGPLEPDMLRKMIKEVFRTLNAASFQHLAAFRIGFREIAQI